ncbi:MAG TPA: hypothetical protein VJV79_35870 [Polyangiaceae bacterium]|nr:hypothetical protein [Polyangiaceae bacterium]
MKKAIHWCSGAVLGLSLSGCGAAGDLDSMEENSLGSVAEALSTPAYEHVQLSAVGSVTLKCPSDKPWLLGTGAQAPASPALKVIDPMGGLAPTSLFVDSGATGGTTTAEGVCSNALGLELIGSSSTGEKTVMCGEGKVAVGGGGDCEGGGRLYRSRPSPDTDGSKPKGWAAGCTSGAVETYAICAWESMNFDFSSCRTERKDGVGTVSVDCPANRTALSAGGYCGDNRPLFSLNLNTDLSGAKVGCQGLSPSVPVHAYVVCCE